MHPSCSLIRYSQRDLLAIDRGLHVEPREVKFAQLLPSLSNRARLVPHELRDALSGDITREDVFLHLLKLVEHRDELLVNGRAMEAALEEVASHERQGAIFCGLGDEYSVLEGVVYRHSVTSFARRARWGVRGDAERGHDALFSVWPAPRPIQAFWFAWMGRDLLE